MSPQPLLLQVIGLQRSGNHAVIQWLRSLYPATEHMNDIPHRAAGNPQRIATIRGLAGNDCVILSHEDSGNRISPEVRLLDNVLLARPEDFPGFRLDVLYILRDPYNCWASRARAHDGEGITSSPEVEPFIADWLDLAALFGAHPERFVLYNTWFRDADYRRAVCARLGGAYAEATLNEVVSTGGGSSFDGYVRPSYRQILANPGAYLSRRFVGRLRSDPGAYLRRLLTPKPSGRKLLVETRWEYLLAHPSADRLFGDDALRQASEAIFGFSIDRTGRMHRPAGTGCPRADA